MNFLFFPTINSKFTWKICFEFALSSWYLRQYSKVVAVGIFSKAFNDSLGYATHFRECVIFINAVRNFVSGWLHKSEDLNWGQFVFFIYEIEFILLLLKRSHSRSDMKILLIPSIDSIEFFWRLSWRILGSLTSLMDFHKKGFLISK